MSNNLSGRTRPNNSISISNILFLDALYPPDHSSLPADHYICCGCETLLSKLSARYQVLIRWNWTLKPVQIVNASGFQFYSNTIGEAIVIITIDLLCCNNNNRSYTNCFFEKKNWNMNFALVHEKEQLVGMQSASNSKYLTTARI